MISLVNETQFLDEDEARAIIRWCAGDLEPDGPVTITVHESLEDAAHEGQHHDGLFRGFIDDEGVLRYTISVYIPEYPFGWWVKKGMKRRPPAISCEGWQESLVCCVSHELEHLRQYMEGPDPETGGHFRHLKTKTVYVRPQMFDEVAAEWAEYNALLRWRERRAA